VAQASNSADTNARQIVMKREYRRDSLGAAFGDLIAIGELAGCSGRFSATVPVGLRPPKHNENRRGHNSRGGSGEIELTSGAIEAEQLFGPERA
jgi:hypothetical protein